jgi:hypothetical protein
VGSGGVKSHSTALSARLESTLSVLADLRAASLDDILSATLLHELPDAVMASSGVRSLAGEFSVYPNSEFECVVIKP